MNQWAFVIAAYAVTGAGTVVLSLAAWALMRRAEHAVEALTRR